ncbi:MAG TPA: adenylate kinase [Actinomycetota bacterium]
MRIILVGPPGAGKGTQAGRIAERFDVPHIATGDLFRKNVSANTDVGRRAKAAMDRGELVPDDVVLEMLRARLDEPDAKAGFLLDGFPRTVAQADALATMLHNGDSPLDAVVAVRVPDEVIVSRIAQRRSCPVCGRIYNESTHPAAIPGVCDADGERLVQRSDDMPEVVRTRLKVYHDQTEPLIAYYRERDLLRTVDGVGPVEEVEARIAKELAER